MQKFHEISNFANVKTFPNIKAHADMLNYKVVEVDQINKVTSFATAATAGKDLCVVMNDFWNQTGDLYFGDRTLKAGDPVLCVGLESLATRFLVIGVSHITSGLPALGEDLIPDGVGNGNWIVGAAPTEGVYLTVTGVTTLPAQGNLDGPNAMTEAAVIAQIVSI
jgi:hypothetical protein